MILSTFDKYDVIIFDLDNTLYDDQQYYNEVNEQIGSYIFNKYEIGSHKIKSFLSAGLTYSQMCEHFGINELDKCLEIRRSCKMPFEMRLDPDMEEILLKRQGKNVFAVLTNGNKQQQQNKVAQINWPVTMDFFYASPQKPDPSGIFEIQKKYSTLNCLMIGDSLEDQECAKNAKIDFIFAYELTK